MKLGVLELFSTGMITGTVGLAFSRWTLVILEPRQPSKELGLQMDLGLGPFQSPLLLLSDFVAIAPSHSRCIRSCWLVVCCGN